MNIANFEDSALCEEKLVKKRRAPMIFDDIDVIIPTHPNDFKKLYKRARF